MKMETERLILREYTLDDFEALKAVICDAETMKYYSKAYSDNDVHRWIKWNLENYGKYGFGLWAVTLKSSGEFIGDCGITMQNIDNEQLPELGFHINKKYHRQGYAKEAATAVLDFVWKKTKFDRIYCYQQARNIPSRKTAESLGFQFVKEYTVDGDEPHSVYMISRE
jgi:Acetyltransferases, including N-acetylases of ribosomal proteins